MSYRTRNHPSVGEFGVFVSSRDGNRPSEGEFGVFVSDHEMETTQVWENPGGVSLPCLGHRGMTNVPLLQSDYASSLKDH
jgi:hypothetical protein